MVMVGLIWLGLNPIVYACMVRYRVRVKDVLRLRMIYLGHSVL